MKKNLLSKLVIAAACLSLSATASMAGLFGESVEGIVQSVNPNMITVSKNDANNQNASLTNQQGTPQEMTIDIQVNNDTKFSDNGSIAQIQSGDQVKVKYKEENGMNVATEIKKEAPKATY